MAAKKETIVSRQRAKASAARSPTGTPSKAPATRARSAVTGKMVTKKTAKQNSATTVEEEVVSPLDSFIKSFKVPTKIPKNFGAVADDLYLTRENRLRLSKIVDAMDKHERALKNHLIDNLSKKDSTGAAGRVARAQIVISDEPAAQDWEETYKHIKKTGNFDLLNRALNKSAVKARWEAGKEVPGVGHFPVTKVSVTKV